MFTVVDHHVFVWVEADYKFTGTATTEFFDAPDPAIVGHVVFGLRMSQIPNLADVVRDCGCSSGLAQLVGVVQD